MTAHAQDKTELNYSGWINLYPHHAAAVGAIEKGFEKKFPDVDWILNDVPFDQALKQATVAALAGNAPDNIHLIAGWVPALIEIGALEPLNDYFTAEEWSQIPAASLEFGHLRRPDHGDALGPRADHHVLQPQPDGAGRARPRQAAPDLARADGAGQGDLRPARCRWRPRLRRGAAHRAQPQLGPVDHPDHLRP